MYPSFSKLAVVIAVIFVLWYALRWLNRAPANLMRRRPERSPQRPAGAAAIEDLVACAACGTFVAAGARACGKPGCPQPR